jgi:uncharacterized phiE125 gp8 family phage protein
MVTNLIREVSFSDTQSVDNAPAGLLTLVYTATGGETSFQQDELVNATVTNLSRDGVVYTPVTTFSGSAKKEFIHYPADGAEDAGTIVFHSGLPPMEAGEDSVINYVPEAATAVTTEPVTLDEVKKWMNIELDFTFYDALITALITAARAKCEGFVSLSFVSRNVTAILVNDLGGIRLPYGPTGNILHVYDSESNEVTSDNYTITGNTAKRIDWPRTGDCYAPAWDSVNSNSVIKVVYNAGYSVLPNIFKTAIMMQTAWMYENRGDTIRNGLLSPEAEMLLKPYRAIV